MRNAVFRSLGGGSRWPRTIRIRQDASLTTAEPAIAVAHDQIMDRIAYNPWDEIGSLFLTNDLRLFQLAAKPMRNLAPCPVKDPGPQEQAQMAAWFRHLLQKFGRCAD
jgi:hypothetical protein